MSDGGRLNIHGKFDVRVKRVQVADEIFKVLLSF